MVKYFNAFLKVITTAIELVISFILAASIIVMIGRLLLDFHNIPYLDVYPVSYTHLDVYKRQLLTVPDPSCRPGIHKKSRSHGCPPPSDILPHYKG